MKRRLFPIVIAFMLMPLAVPAESFSSLWKQVAAAEKKDLPQTKISILQTIIDKATKEKAYGHLLKAQIESAAVLAVVSPDSLAPAVKRIELQERSAAEKDDVLSAVYSSALGTIYSRCPSLSDSSDVVSATYYKKSVAHPEKLAKAFATGYAPFVVDGVDSRIFGDDLLHIIGMDAGEYKLMHDYYDATGNRAAACICALQMVKDSRQGNVKKMQKSTYLQSIDSLLVVYGDLVEAGEVAIARYEFMETAEDATAEYKINYLNYALTKWGAWQRMNVLRNAQRKLTLPYFHVSLGDQISVPGVPRDVVVMAACNIGGLKITVRRVDIGGDTTLDPSNDDDYAELKKYVDQEVVFTQSLRYIGQPDYKVSRDTMHIDGLPAGVYLVEFKADNEAVAAERALLRVSGLYVMSERLPDKRIRMAVVDAVTGMPVPGAMIRVTTVRYGSDDIVETLACDDNGEKTFSYGQIVPTSFYAYTDSDKALPQMRIGGYYSYYGNTATGTTGYANLYTDRKIYRPGQTVHVAAIVYSYNNENRVASAVNNKELSLTLRDSNGKVVQTTNVVTNEYGETAVDFVLPKSDSAPTGRYYIKSDYGNASTAYFSVEEYKRPTFTVEMDRVKEEYSSGDTINVCGTAKTFADVPVQGGKVVATVTRRAVLWWRSRASETSPRVVFNDTVTTDNEGRFVLRVPLEMPETTEENPSRYFSFDVQVNVTDIAGETRQGSIAIPLSDKPTAFRHDIPERSEIDSLKTITFTYKNNAGECIDGDVEYSIDGRQYRCKANTATPIDKSVLSSASHSLVAVCGTDTLRTDFVTFSIADKKTVVKTNDWFYQTSETFPSDGSPTYIQFGASAEQLHVLYTVLASGRMIENGSIDLQGELMTRAFTYKEDYGDGIVVNMAWVKDGTMYKHSASIGAPKPDCSLKIGWTTFRDRLVPGDKETWTLNITTSDGAPAAAQMIATMFDKSLDNIVKHSWKFSLPSRTYVPRASWGGHTQRLVSLYGEMPYKPFAERAMDYSHFDISADICDAQPMVVETRMSRSKAVTALSATDAETTTVTANVDASVASEETSTEQATTVNADYEKEEAVDVLTQIRENLSETAFFYSGLTTDAKGNIDISFTLPESVTTWRFMGLAHDKSMNSGLIEGEAVAKKTVMVVPNVPRFVRSTDRISIAARLMNTSESKTNGTARLALINPETEKEVYHKSLRYEIDSMQTTVLLFDVDMSSVANDGLLICRVTAEGRGYSDGEQHYLPVLSNKELVTNTVAFTQSEPGTTVIDLTTLFPVKDKENKLTVEYTENPSWLMLQTLPSVENACDGNAIGLASAYYSLALAQCIMQQSPVIEQTINAWIEENADGEATFLSSLQTDEELRSIVLSETPWVAEAESETDRMQRLADFFDEGYINNRLTNILSRIKKLQNDDGSFSWWPGMQGNRHITQAVAEMLVRLTVMTGETKNTSQIISSAMAYLSARAAEEVAKLKKTETETAVEQTISSAALHYLYLQTIAEGKMSESEKADAQYLISRLETKNASLSIYDKALSAIVMAGNGREAKASEMLQSIVEHTVYAEDKGRYFDTKKATYSWRDYRIPTQTAVIEALKRLSPSDKQTIEQMQHWLLQSKRTQMWDTPINTVNAVYAFLGGDASEILATSDAPAVMRVNGTKMEHGSATAAIGYQKASRKGDNMKSLSIEKKSAGTSWGAVYAQFMQSTADVDDASTGMTLSRDIIKNGKILDESALSALNVGDRITVRVTITADRDYDFVYVADRRASCFEPTTQISGMVSAGRCYCSPKDNVTNYYFDSLAKGKHVVETDYYVVAAGSFSTGTCVAQCAYSPDFGARDTAKTLVVGDE